MFRMFPFFFFFSFCFYFYFVFCILFCAVYFAICSVKSKFFLIVLHAPPAKCLRHLNNKGRPSRKIPISFNKQAAAQIKCGFGQHPRLLRSSKWQFSVGGTAKDKSDVSDDGQTVGKRTNTNPNPKPKPDFDSNNPSPVSWMWNRAIVKFDWFAKLIGN